MRVPCLCTKGDYECDMNYVRGKSGDCELVADPLNKLDEKKQSEKEEDCALEGYFYISQGYRKIPGNMCYGGVQLDPIKKPCSSFVWLSAMFKSKGIILAALAAVALYYGWPIIEAIILVLPIPDPKDSLDRVKNAASSATDMVSGAITSNRPPAEYSQNLNAQPDGFMMDDDNSDEDIGKLNIGGNNFDDKNDDELVPTSSGNNELIDLGGSTSVPPGRKAAAKIPKLSGPK